MTALTQWYPILFPDERGPDGCLREMAALTGEEPTPDPHATLAYPTLPAVTEAQLAQLRALASPTGPIRAEGPLSPHV